jgi:hypothetical protein
VRRSLSPYFDEEAYPWKMLLGIKKTLIKKTIVIFDELGIKNILILIQEELTQEK